MDVTYWWLIPAAFVPAMLGMILIFLDQQITSVIVNRKEHKLQVSLTILRLVYLLTYVYCKLASRALRRQPRCAFRPPKAPLPLPVRSMRACFMRRPVSINAPFYFMYVVRASVRLRL